MCEILKIHVDELHFKCTVCKYENVQLLKPSTCHLKHFAKHILKHFILLFFLIMSHDSPHSSRHSLEISSAITKLAWIAITEMASMQATSAR